MKLSPSARREKIFNFIDRMTVASSRELEQIAGNRMIIKRLVEVGSLVPIARSYYTTKKSNWNAAVILMIARFFPKAIIDEETALFVYGLSNTVGKRPVVCIPTGISLKNPAFRVKRRKQSRLTGIRNLKFREENIKIFEVERVLCELASSGTNEVLKSAFKRAKADGLLDPRKLEKYARMFKSNLLKIFRDEDDISSLDIHDASFFDKLIAEISALYSEYGPNSLTFSFLSANTDYSESQLRKVFKSEYEIKKAMFDFRERDLRSGVFELPPRGSLAPVDYVKMILRVSLENLDREPRQMYLFQNWALAEESYFVEDIVKNTCSAAISMTKAQILEACPGLDPLEAECRATLIFGMLDHYRYMRQFYIEIMDVSASKEKFMRQYRNTLVDTFVDRMFFA